MVVHEIGQGASYLRSSRWQEIFEMGVVVVRTLFTFQPKIKQIIEEKECGQCPGIYREKHWTDEWSE